MPARVYMNILVAEDEYTVEGEPDSNSMLAAPVSRGRSAPAFSGCARCHKPGHIAADCKLPDTRRCHACNKVGHLVYDCPAVAERRKAKAAAAAGTKSA